jgi:hypothetical protein
VSDNTRTFKTPIGPVVVREPYYLASCDGCGWIGSSEECGGGEEDCCCPKCYRPGADCGVHAQDCR